MASWNLTSYESLALESPLNLSDGHPRQAPTPEQAAILSRTGSLFGTLRDASFAKVEAEAHERFFGALGQHTAPVATGRILSCYSSSVAMDIFARALRQRTDRVGLLHPTFDNIPDLLRGWGHTLLPVAESTLAERDAAVFDGDVGCLFVTTPNNPTGWVLEREAMRWLATECAARGVLLALDTSFRGFDTRSWYDCYAILEDASVEYVVIEDTGKLWPTQELKAGFLVCGTEGIPLVDAFSDVLLTISPVVLALIGELATDAADGGFRQLHTVIGDNRSAARELLSAIGTAPPDPDSRVSVERVLLPPGHLTAQAAYELLRGIGVNVLPCGPFHWSEPHAGASFIRISLARDSDMLRHALELTIARLTDAAGRVSHR